MAYPKTFQQTLAPITWLNYIFGQSVFEIGGRPVIFLSHVYRIMCITLLVGVQFYQGNSLNLSVALYQKITFTVILYVSVIVAIMSMILGGAHGLLIKQLVSRCAEVNNTMVPFGGEKGYRKYYRNTMLYFSVWLVIALCYYIVDSVWMLNNFSLMQMFLVSIGTILPVFYNSIVVLSFLTYVRCVRDLLRKMNDTMADIVESTDAKGFIVKENKRSRRIAKVSVAMGYSDRKHFVQHLLETMKQVHLEIIQISRGFNRAFCIQLLLELILEFSLITGALYNVYFDLVSMNEKTEDTESIVPMVLWIILNSSKVLVVNAICDQAISEMRRTGRIIRELGTLFTDEDIKHEMQQFSMQVILHPLYYSVAGFVCLDNKFTKAFFTTVTTYLVILIQMSSTPAALKSLTKEI